MSDPHYPPSEPIPIPGQRPPPQSIWKKLFAPLAAVGVILVKFKGLFIPFLKYFPVLFKTGGTMLISVLFYGWSYGWPFGIGLVLLIFIHEYGHLHAAKKFGLNVGWPVFIPFAGAFIALKEAPKSARIEAEVGIGGPIWGTGGALLCFFLYQWLHTPIFLILAQMGFWLNLFNLIPILPLDGGRIVAAVSPWLWVVGLAVMIFIVIKFSFNFFVVLIIIMSLPRVFNFLRGKSEEDPSYYDLSPRERVWMGIQYFGLAAALGYLMHLSQEMIHQIHPPS